MSGVMYCILYSAEVQRKRNDIYRLRFRTGFWLTENCKVSSFDTLLSLTLNIAHWANRPWTWPIMVRLVGSTPIIKKTHIVIVCVEQNNFHEHKFSLNIHQHENRSFSMDFKLKIDFNVFFILILFHNNSISHNTVFP